MRRISMTSHFPQRVNPVGFSPRQKPSVSCFRNSVSPSDVHLHFDSKNIASRWSKFYERIQSAHTVVELVPTLLFLHEELAVNEGERLFAVSEGILKEVSVYFKQVLFLPPPMKYPTKTWQAMAAHLIYEINKLKNEAAGLIPEFPNKISVDPALEGLTEALIEVEAFLSLVNRYDSQPNSDKHRVAAARAVLGDQAALLHAITGIFKQPPGEPRNQACFAQRQVLRDMLKKATRTHGEEKLTERRVPPRPVITEPPSPDFLKLIPKGPPPQVSPVSGKPILEEAIRPQDFLDPDLEVILRDPKFNRLLDFVFEAKALAHRFSHRSGRAYLANKANVLLASLNALFGPYMIWILENLQSRNANALSQLEEKIKAIETGLAGLRNEAYFVFKMRVSVPRYFRSENVPGLIRDYLRAMELLRQVNEKFPPAAQKPLKEELAGFIAKAESLIFRILNEVSLKHTRVNAPEDTPADDLPNFWTPRGPEQAGMLLRIQSAVEDFRRTFFDAHTGTGVLQKAHHALTKEASPS